MNEILMTVGLFTFIIYAIFNIIYLIDLRKTTLALRDFVEKTEKNLNPSLTELTRALTDIRKITSDVSNVAERLRTAVGAAASVEKTMQNLYGYYRENLGQPAQSNIAGIKAGVKAGVVNLIKNLKTERRIHNE